MKKYLHAFTILSATIIMLLALSVGAFAADNPSILTVKANKELGLYGDVRVTASYSGPDKSGNDKYEKWILFIPGKAITKSEERDNFFFSWEGNHTVRVNGSTPGSGNVPIPSVNTNEATQYTIDDKTYDIYAYQGSSDVAALFLSIDETLTEELDDGKGVKECTIKRMYDDTDHNSSCYGNLLFDGEQNEIATHDMSIKGRGNYTWYNRDKRPFNITIYKPESKKNKRFDKKDSVEFIDGVEAKKWSLLANYADSSLLKNKVGYDLAKDLGVGLDSTFVDLWMNGQYLGNYLMTPKSDYNAPDYGYMLELDNHIDNNGIISERDYQFSMRDVGGDTKTLISIKDSGDKVIGRDEKGESIKQAITNQEIEDYMKHAWDAIAELAKSNKQGSTEYLKYIDLDSWAKVYLLNEVYKDFDVVSGSILMHRDGTSDDDKLIAGPVWDLDNALGKNQGNSELNVNNDMKYGAEGWYINAISITPFFLQYLGKSPVFMQRVYEMYNEYASCFEALQDDVVAQKTLIDKSAAMNFQRWNVNQQKYNNGYVGIKDYYKIIGSTYYAVTDEWEDYVNNLSNYLYARANYLKTNLKIETAPLIPTVEGTKSISIGGTIELHASIPENANHNSTRWERSYDGKHWDTISGATGTTYIETDIKKAGERYYRFVLVKNGATITPSYYDKSGNRKNVASTFTTIKSASDPHSIFVNKLEFEYSKPKVLEGWEYDTGESKKIVEEKATINPEKNGIILYSLTNGDEPAPNDNSDWDLDPTNYSVSEIGVYKVWCKVIGDDTYGDVAPQYVTVNVTKKKPEVTKPVLIEGWVYDKTTKPLVSEEAKTTGGKLWYAQTKDSDVAPTDETEWKETSSELVATNAGTYYVWYKVQGDDVYDDVSPEYMTVVVDKADPEVVPPVLVEGWTYSDGTDKNIVSKKATTSGGTLWYALTKDSENVPTDESDWTKTTDEFTSSGIGIYRVWYKVDGDDNYNDKGVACVSVAVSKSSGGGGGGSGGGGGMPPEDPTDEPTVETKASFDKPGKMSDGTVIPAIEPIIVTKVTYDGTIKSPVVEVPGLTKYSEYVVSGMASDIGDYTATITLIGDKYAGEMTIDYKIVPAGTKIKSVKGAKKAIAVKWSKQKVMTSGYQLRYSLKSTMKSSKTITVKGNKTVSKKLTKLKAKKKYYVQVRTYKTVGKKKYYSSWSAKKTIKTK